MNNTQNEIHTLINRIFDKTYKIRAFLFNHAKVGDFIVTIIIICGVLSWAFVQAKGWRSSIITIAFMLVQVSILLFFVKGKFFRKPSYKLHSINPLCHFAQGFNLFESLFRYFLLANNDSIVVLGKNDDRRYSARYLFMQNETMNRYIKPMHRKDLGYRKCLTGYPNVNLGAGLYSSVPLVAIVAMK